MANENFEIIYSNLHGSTFSCLSFSCFPSFIYIQFHTYNWLAAVIRSKHFSRITTASASEVLPPEKKTKLTVFAVPRMSYIDKTDTFRPDKKTNHTNARIP